MDPKRHLLIGALVGGGLFILYGPGAFRWLELKSQQAHMESEVISLQIENRRLYEETRRLREDPDYAEAVARREMGFVRPGETKIHFRSSTATSSSNQKSPSDSSKQSLR